MEGEQRHPIQVNAACAGCWSAWEPPSRWLLCVLPDLQPEVDEEGFLGADCIHHPALWGQGLYDQRHPVCGTSQ